MVTPDAPSSIRAIGALPATYGAIGIGVAWLWPAERRGRVARAVLLVGLILVGLLHLGWTYRDGFDAWPAHREVYWRYKAHFADIAAYLDAQPSPQPAVVFETWVDPVDVRGLRRDLVHDEREPRWTQAGRSFVWPAGGDRFTLAMPIFSAADPDIWRLFASGPPVISTSPYRMPDGRPGVTFYAIEVEPRLSDFLAQVSDTSVTAPEGTRVGSPPVNFDGQIAFLGCQALNTPTASSDGGLRLVTLWRVLRDSPEPLNIFVHLLDANGDLIAQHDGFDVWTASLSQGDVVAQLHPISLEAAPPFSAAETKIQLGAYRRADLWRLPVVVDGVEVADRLWLSLAEVTP
jgi:hypothetical protein